MGRYSVTFLPRITTSLATLRVAAALLALVDEYRVVLVICCGCSQPLMAPSGGSRGATTGDRRRAVRSVYRKFSLPGRGGQVLGLILNCSESRLLPTVTSQPWARIAVPAKAVMPMTHTESRRPMWGGAAGSASSTQHGVMLDARRKLTCDVRLINLIDPNVNCLKHCRPSHGMF